MNLRSIPFLALPALLYAAASSAEPPGAPKHAPNARGAVSTSITHATVPMPAAAAVTPGSQQALNPQPLPPKIGASNPGAFNSLNPQPLPPKVGGNGAGTFNSLNPQPLPPKVGGNGAGTFNALNPQPLPPKVGTPAAGSRVASPQQ